MVAVSGHFTLQAMSRTNHKFPRYGAEGSKIDSTSANGFLSPCLLATTSLQLHGTYKMSMVYSTVKPLRKDTPIEDNHL